MMHNKSKEKSSAKDLVVYWSPDYIIRDEDPDWNIMYSDPVSVLSSLRNIKNDKVESKDNYLYCPAFKDTLSNVFEFSNSGIDATYEWTSSSFINNGAYTPTSTSFISLREPRLPCLENTRVIQLALAWNFFSEESLTMQITPPFFSDSSFSKDASIIPGSFDIGRWFRPVPADFQVWGNDVDKLTLKSNDPLFYARFMTDRNVILKRFMLTPEISSIITSLIATRNLFGRFRSLEDRYSDFTRSKTNKVILHHIRKNLLD